MHISNKLEHLLPLLLKTKICFAKLCVFSKETHLRNNFFPKTFKSFGFNFFLIMSDDGYSRNVSFPLISINTFLFDSNKLKLILSLFLNPV